MAASEWPAAVVDAQLLEPAVGPAVGDDRDTDLNPPGLGIEVDDHLLEPARPHDHVVDVVDRHAPLREPGLSLGDERLERSRAPDASAHGVVVHRLAGERPHERIGLPGHQAVVVGHRVEPLPLPLLLQSRQRRRGEQLGRPRHWTSVPRLGIHGQGDRIAAREHVAHLLG
jgi:hypothetical protein